MIIHVWIYLCAFEKKIKNISQIFEKKLEKKIYIKIQIIDKILNSLCI